MNRASSATGWVKNPDGTLGWTLNPISGCRNHVKGMCKGGNFPCYAYKLANGRLRSRYLANENVAPYKDERDYMDNRHNPFYPRFWPERLLDVPFTKKPLGIFVCDMSDLFGIGIPDFWTEKVFVTINTHPEHRFYLLTKQPQNLPQWSPFPENCWVGATATNEDMFYSAMKYLWLIKATVKFISAEPLLGRVVLSSHLEASGVGQVIIGAMTCSGGDLSKLASLHPQLTPMPFGNRYTLQPKIEWVEEIVRACDKAGISVFLKDNLSPLLKGQPEPLQTRVFQTDTTAYFLPRQELPDVK